MVRGGCAVGDDEGCEVDESEKEDKKKEREGIKKERTGVQRKGSLEKFKVSMARMCAICIAKRTRHPHPSLRLLTFTHISLMFHTYHRPIAHSHSQEWPLTWAQKVPHKSHWLRHSMPVVKECVPELCTRLCGQIGHTENLSPSFFFSQSLCTHSHSHFSSLRQLHHRTHRPILTHTLYPTSLALRLAIEKKRCAYGYPSDPSQKPSPPPPPPHHHSPSLYPQRSLPTLSTPTLAALQPSLAPVFPPIQPSQTIVASTAPTPSTQTTNLSSTKPSETRIRPATGTGLAPF